MRRDFRRTYRSPFTSIARRAEWAASAQPADRSRPSRRSTAAQRELLRDLERQGWHVGPIPHGFGEARGAISKALTRREAGRRPAGIRTKVR